MRMRTKSAAIIAACLLMTASGPAGVAASEPLLELQWAQLMPAAPPKLKSFLPRKGPADITSAQDDGSPAPQTTPEGRWMSGPRTSGGPAPVVESLDGKRVHIGGYVVPLDFTRPP